VSRSRAAGAAPYLLLAAAIALSLAALFSLTSGMTFFQDTWAYLMHRRELSPEALFNPHNEHIVVIPVAIENLLLELFGMSSALPEYVVLYLLLTITVLLLFVYVHRRLGPWPALLAAVPVLFLGFAWEVLLWPFEISLVGSTMTGLAMLLALEREDRRGDLAACLLVTLSIGFSSLGLAFAVAAFVDVLQRRATLGLGRLYVPLVGLAFYAAWYLGYGHEAESFLSVQNVARSPVFVVEGLAASVGALSGLNAFNAVGERPYAGAVLLVAIVALLVWRLHRWPDLSSRFWPVAAAGTTFWALAAFNRGPGREAVASRYMHFGAILILLAAADLLKGVRFEVRALMVGAALVIAATAVNYGELRNRAEDLREQTVLTKAGLGAMEIARETAPPSFTLTPEIAGTPSLIDVNAGEFLPAAREHGSPAYSPAELAEAPAAGRRQADVVLSQALPLETETVPGLFRPEVAKSCVEVGGGQPGPEIELGPGPARIEVAPGPQAGLSLRRFATGEYPVPTEGAPGDSLTILRIPADKAPQPWYLLVEATQPAWVCP
jgi:hypothetical protein